MVDRVAALENPKIVRLCQLVARFVDDEWEGEQLMEETAVLIHEFLQEATATGPLDSQGRR